MREKHRGRVFLYQKSLVSKQEWKNEHHQKYERCSWSDQFLSIHVAAAGCRHTGCQSCHWNQLAYSDQCCKNEAVRCAVSGQSDYDTGQYEYAGTNDLADAETHTFPEIQFFVVHSYTPFLSATNRASISIPFSRVSLGQPILKRRKYSPLP